MRQVIDEIGQIRKQQFGLVGGSARRTAAKEDNRWSPLLPEDQQGAEIGIGRDDHPLFGRGQLKDPLVFRFRHGAIADMDGIVPGHPQQLRDVGERALSTRNFIGSRAAATHALERLQRRTGGPL